MQILKGSVLQASQQCGWPGIGLLSWIRHIRLVQLCNGRVEHLLGVGTRDQGEYVPLGVQLLTGQYPTFANYMARPRARG